jgi:hypothetical protein
MADYTIGFAESGYRLDREEFRAHLLARWPELPVESAPLGGYPWLVFYLPSQPVSPRVDPSAPGGLRWYPFVPGLSDWRVYHSLSPDGAYLWLEDAEDFDCAVVALWLRDWLPPAVPLIATRVHDEQVFASVAVWPGMSLLAVIRGFRDDVPVSPRLLRPLDPVTEREVEALVRQVLGAAADQFFPKR